MTRLGWWGSCRAGNGSGTGWPWSTTRPSAQHRDVELADELCHSSLPRALAATLRISIGEANRRVRAAEALTERMA